MALVPHRSIPQFCPCEIEIESVCQRLHTLAAVSGDRNYNEFFAVVSNRYGQLVSLVWKTRYDGHCRIRLQRTLQQHTTTDSLGSLEVLYRLTREALLLARNRTSLEHAPHTFTA